MSSNVASVAAKPRSDIAPLPPRYIVWQLPVSEPAFSRFTEWANRYTQASAQRGDLKREAQVARERAEKISPAPSLPAQDQKRVESGKSVYATTCNACHQPNGLGQEGLAPPLVGSEWVAGNEQRLVRIMLNGLRGPLKVNGQKYDLDMPSLGMLEDQQIADVLTYVRREWGHEFPPVSINTVKNLRAQFSSREDAWTEDELLQVR